MCIRDRVDSRIVNVLGGIAQSCSKFSNDLRILANFKEMEEPFEKNQIGSSAVSYTHLDVYKRQGRPYQIAKAIGEGNVALHSAVAYLAENKGKKE